MTQVDLFHLRPFFGLNPDASSMTRNSDNHYNIRPSRFLDTLHFGVLIACAAWTTHVIAQEQFGSFSNATQRLAQLTHLNNSSVTIKLDEGARTAAR
jgi:hypothetical protein